LFFPPIVTFRGVLNAAATIRLWIQAATRNVSHGREFQTMSGEPIKKLPAKVRVRNTYGNVFIICFWIYRPVDWQKEPLGSNETI
jgi:hypothetical protein